ncbi:MAG: hypothetical protein ACR2HN_08620 [Tepidiformaceae bacterium]
MMLHKSCRRCGGDMFFEEEGRFKDIVCLQCGNRPPLGPRSIEELQTRGQ